MARVYVSSTVADLEAERQAVIDWLVAANHQPVHSYHPNSETVRESCRDDIDGCDLYVLILGHRYGFQPEDGNPDKLSITHLEFRRAGQSSIPRIALLRTSVPNIRLSDLLVPVRAALVQGFISEVQREVRPGEFSDPSGLLQGLSTGVQRELDRLAAAAAPQAAARDERVVQILATLTQELERKNQLLDASAADIVALRGQVKELTSQLRAAVERTVDAAAQPGAGQAAIAAADALDAGNTRPAEALLASQEQHEASQIGRVGSDDATQRREAAALAREQGALAISHDVRAALAAFERAAEYEPDHTWTHFFVGDLHVALGDVRAAMAAHRRGLARAEALSAGSPANSRWQRDISVGHERIGGTLVLQGHGPDALTAYRTALTIRETLAARDPANTERKRDVFVSHTKIAEVLSAQGDHAGALAAHRAALAIAEALVAQDPANTDWQRDVSVSHNGVADLLKAQGDRPGALAAYRKALAMREALARRDPTKTEWRRDVSVSHSRIGNVLLEQGDHAGALAAYHTDLAIAEELAARDPANTEWQRDLAVSHNKIANVLTAQGDAQAALAACLAALAIREALTARDPANTEWQRDLSYCMTELAAWHEAQGNRKEALRFAESSLDIDERLARLDPTKVMWQDDVGVSRRQVARLKAKP